MLYCTHCCLSLSMYHSNKMNDSMNFIATNMFIVFRDRNKLKNQLRTLLMMESAKQDM